MRVLIAPDKFKGTLTARQAAASIADRVARLRPAWQLEVCPLADGGEGTLDALLSPADTVSRIPVADALGRPVSAPLGRFQGRVLAESASCLGLSLLPPDLRNPETASSFGLGLLLREALKQSPEKITVALGGVATVDGGMGLLQALGAELRTDAGLLTTPASGSSLGKVVSVDLGPAKLALGSIVLEAWCDVLSPLLGPSGAARLFGPQKGAKPDAVERLENGMASCSSLLEKSVGRPLKILPGAGAAGGLGLGLAALGGVLRSGFEAVAEAVGLEGKIRDCDAVVTGEGRLDASTREGKAPWGVLQMSRRLRKPCYVLAGSVQDLGEGWAGASALFNQTVEPGDPRLQDLEARWDGAVHRLLELLPP